MTFIQQLAFHNEFEYRNSDFEVIKDTIIATFCAMLVKIGPLIPKDLAGKFCTFWDETEKNRHIPNISASTGPNFTNFPALVDACMQIIKLKNFRSS